MTAVRFRDCDPMGHVNNAVYVTYLELARFAYWKAAKVGRLEGEVSYIIARLVATAKSVQVAYDYGAGKPVPLPDSLRERIAQFEEVH